MTSDDPERALILTYAPPARRAALAALLALDDALATLLRTTREPAIGQIRLAWWRERLEALHAGVVPAEPVLQAIAAARLNGAALVPIVDGWEVLIEERLDREALGRFAAGRGTLFVAAGGGSGDPLAAAGQGWALADLARHLGDAGEAAEARAMASNLLEAATASRWSREGRAMGAMAHLARRDLRLADGEAPPVGSPARVGRLLWHRLTGR